MMIEIIKQRPLSLYYLWRTCQNKSNGKSESSEMITVKQLLGQLRAERKNLEKIDDPILCFHISSLAFLEEILKSSSEEMLKLLLREIQEVNIFLEPTNEKMGFGACPKSKK